MTVLLAADQVDLYPPSAALDEHGWRLPDTTTSYWSGVGNLQLQPGISIPTAADGGGRGPFGPARDLLGTLFLPADVPLLEGSTAVIRGRWFVISETRQVTDPTDSGLDCWAAIATSIDTWPNQAPTPTPTP